MTPRQDDLVIEEILNAMSKQALEGANGAVIPAIELFSAGVDRLLSWLPEDRRPAVMVMARAHWYSTKAEIEKMRGEGHSRH